MYMTVNVIGLKIKGKKGHIAFISGSRKSI